MNVRLIQAAIDADMTKNEYKVFLTLLMKTAGYGKTADAITAGQISMLTGIRKDHAKKATECVIAASLFDRADHWQYESEYSIPARFQQRQYKTNKPASVPAGDIELKPQAPQPAPAPAPAPEELKKPENMTEQDYAALLPALLMLMIPQATDILALISGAIRDGSIRTTPARYGFALIKQAKAGMLDTSTLRPAVPPPEIKQRQQRQEQAIEAASLAAFMKTAQKFGVNL